MPSLRSYKPLHLCEILYVFMIGVSLYLLLLSRTGEAHTVWEVLHPALIPSLFITISILVILLFSSEKVACKLLFIVAISIILHSFFAIVFPGGDLSGQQTVLGGIRRVYENIPLQYPSLANEPLRFLYTLFIGKDFQAALTVTFARMLSLDILWVHLFLIPVLWGVFVPVAAFLTTKTLGGNDKTSALSALLISAFPYCTYFGAISVPNSLGYIFFSYSLYFTLRNLNSNDSRNVFLMLIFAFFSFLSHYLAGLVSCELIILAYAYKSYKRERSVSHLTAKVSLGISFLFCVSLLPLSLFYAKFFYPYIYTTFTLDLFTKSGIFEIARLLVLGELAYNYGLKTILLNLIGPALALLSMAFLLYKSRTNLETRPHPNVLFMFLGLMTMLIDYRILKLFMKDLPLKAERLWVFRDLIGASFVAFAIYSIKPSLSIAGLKERVRSQYVRASSKSYVLRITSLLSIGLLVVASILFPLLLAGWMTTSLSAAYPQIAPLQTTWNELEAAKFIDENTAEKYVVIGDIWTIFAGERIVGINNPRAYYFGEYNSTGYELFANMRENPSPQWMLQAMNFTDAAIAYFIISEPRLGNDEFNNVVSRALQNEQLEIVHIPQVPREKLYAFSFRKG